MEDYKLKVKDNAVRKRLLEEELLYTNSFPLPVFYKGVHACVSVSNLPGTFEDKDLILEWLRDIRVNDAYIELPSIEVDGHDAFVTLYCLNTMRRYNVPNFLYYHGIISTEDKKHYTISEQCFNVNNSQWPTLKEVILKCNFNEALAYYMSIILAIYKTNKDCEYTHYNLTPQNILMRPVQSKKFDVEYTFREIPFRITNYGYIPTITNHLKSYIRINVDGTKKSFGYNDVTQMPSESKGIYVDRGFPITDAYRLLINILICTRDTNIEVHDGFLKLVSFFDRNSLSNTENDYFIFYNLNPVHIKLGEFIKFILTNHPWLISVSKSNDVLHCMGSKIEIKPSTFNPHTSGPKSLVQLYDRVKFYNGEYQVALESDVIAKEYAKLEKLTSEMQNKEALYEIPKDTSLLLNTKYSNLLAKNIAYMKTYLNSRERVQSQVEILTYILSNYFYQNNETILNLFKHYDDILQESNVYSASILNILVKLRSIIRQDKNLQDIFSSKLLFLETL